MIPIGGTATAGTEIVRSHRMGLPLEDARHFAAGARWWAGRFSSIRGGGMSGQTRLILTLHNHQPIGNFDGVFEGAYVDSYAPFLDLLDEYPEIPVVLHNSGSLFEYEE